MTQATADPFAAPSGDPFGQPAQGGGSYPKPSFDLVNELVMLAPKEIETVKDNFDKEGKKMVDRLTADTVVLSGSYAGQSFNAMWWSQGPIVKAGRVALAKGQKMVLGRLRRFPINEDVKANKFKGGDWAAIDAAMNAWRPGQPQVRYALGLAEYTDEDAAVARAYLATQSPV